MRSVVVHLKSVSLPGCNLIYTMQIQKLMNYAPYAMCTFSHSQGKGGGKKQTNKHYKSILKSSFPSCFVTRMLRHGCCSQSVPSSSCRCLKWPAGGTWNWAGHTRDQLLRTGHVSSWWLTCECHLAVVQGCAFWGFSSESCCPVSVHRYFSCQTKEIGNTINKKIYIYSEY